MRTVPGIDAPVALADLDGGGLARAIRAEHGGHPAAASAVSVSPSTAVTGPYRFTMPEISTAGVLSTHAVYWPPLISGPIGSDIL